MNGVIIPYCNNVFEWFVIDKDENEITGLHWQETGILKIEETAIQEIQEYRGNIEKVRTEDGSECNTTITDWNFLWELLILIAKFTQ